MVKANDFYQKHFITFMSYLNQVEYEADRSFSDVELGTITPVDIYRWMCTKAYGKEDIGPGDLPCLCQSSTLEVIKKSISWYMPNRTASCDYLAARGNPTKSIEVNGLLKDVL
jgi:hypothetical protein